MKKRLMAFLLAVVTTVGSLPTAPVFAAEDDYEEVVVVEEAGDVDVEVVSADKIDTVKVISENGTEIEEASISVNETLTVKVEFSALNKKVSDNVANYAVEVTSADTKVATAKTAKLVSENGIFYAEGIEIKGVAAGTSVVTFDLVSGNAAKSVKAGTLTVKVAAAATTTEETTTDDTVSNNTVSDNTVSDNAVEPDYEAIAEAQKDAEGFSAFTQMIDIDPDAQFQSIEMVVKQSFTDEALKGFTYNDATKKADKKIATISKKGKLAAKKVGKIELKNGDRVISVNVVKPAMPKKESVAGGAKTDITISGLESTSLNVVFVSSDPAKASVSYDSAKRTAYVTGHVKGKVTVTAYVNGKTYKTKVTVTSNAPADFLGYINKNTKKSFSVKGVKSFNILAANGTEASVKGKKFTAGTKAGVVSVNGVDKKGNVVVSGNVIVQDLKLELGTGKSASVNGVDVNAGKTLTLKKEGKGNKADTYEITVKLDQKEGVKGGIKKGYAKLVFAGYAQKQQVVFKSSKAANVFCNGNGVIVAKKAAKKAVTLTGKVNGKTIKIKVKVEE